MAELADQLAQHASANHAILDEHGNVRADARGPTPTEAELEQHHAAPGEPALLPMGVVYQGDWKRFGDGIARHVRDQAVALATAGVPVWLQAVNEQGLLDGELEPQVLKDVGHLRHVTLSSIPICIRQIIFRDAASLRALILPAGARLAGKEGEDTVYRSTIVYTSWERDRIHGSMVEILQRCGQVWVPCERNRKAFVESGVPTEKVFVVPYPYDPASEVCCIPAPRGSESAPDGKRFYAIGKWEPRKRLHQLVGAFLTAFTPRDRASLTIKTHGWGSWSEYPTIEESIAHWSESAIARSRGWTPEAMNRRIRIIASKIPESEIVDLHRKNNIYISAGAGEAWDLPAFDAKCAGNRMVYVGFGGPEDYADESDVRVGWSHMEPVDADYGWEPDARWAAVSRELVAQALLEVEPPPRRIHPPSFNRRFSRHAVGESMRFLVTMLADDLHIGLGNKILQAGSFA